MWPAMMKRVTMIKPWLNSEFPHSCVLLATHSLKVLVRQTFAQSSCCEWVGCPRCQSWRQPHPPMRHTLPCTLPCVCFNDKPLPYYVCYPLIMTTNVLGGLAAAFKAFMFDDRVHFSPERRTLNFSGASSVNRRPSNKRPICLTNK